MRGKTIAPYLKRVGNILFITVFALAFVAAVHPTARSEIRGAVLKDYRTLISSTHADLVGDGSSYTVAKIETRDSLLLEIYRTQADGSDKLVEKIELADSRDGFFNFEDRATNLAVDDIDNDGRPEILVPSFDHELVGRLNIFHYNDESKGFERLIR